MRDWTRSRISCWWWCKQVELLRYLLTFPALKSYCALLSAKQVTAMCWFEEEDKAWLGYYPKTSTSIMKDLRQYGLNNRNNLMLTNSRRNKRTKNSKGQTNNIMETCHDMGQPTGKQWKSLGVLYSINTQWCAADVYVCLGDCGALVENSNWDRFMKCSAKRGSLVPELPTQSQLAPVQLNGWGCQGWHKNCLFVSRDLFIF